MLVQSVNNTLVCNITGINGGTGVSPKEKENFSSGEGQQITGSSRLAFKKHTLYSLD